MGFTLYCPACARALRRPVAREAGFANTVVSREKESPHFQTVFATSSK
jgi:hypothetical protein